jgi:DNA repair protein RadC
VVDGRGAAAVAISPEHAPTPERAALAIFLESAGWPYDSQRIADALLDEFGSLGALAAGSERRIKRVAGKGVARLLRAHADLLHHGLIEEVVARPVMSDRNSLEAFLRQEIGFAPQECLLALFVDSRCGLI